MKQRLIFTEKGKLRAQPLTKEACRTQDYYKRMLKETATKRKSIIGMKVKGTGSGITQIQTPNQGLLFVTEILKFTVSLSFLIVKCGYLLPHKVVRGFPGGSMIKNPSTNAGDIKDRVQFLGQEEPLEEDMETHSSILVWRIPWMEESDGLQSVGSQSQT